MTDVSRPLILYIPGLLPKPEPEIHRDALLRCVLAGVQRVDNRVAMAIEADSAAFDIVSWTFDFYGEYRDFALDRDAVEAVIEKPAADERDVTEATSLQRRFTRWLYRLGDLLPFLIPHVANERMEVHLRDLRRYLQNDNGIAEHTRRMLKLRLHAAAEERRPVLLIGHSMGSVIAYDSLWQMTHSDKDDVQIDLLMTMGSPLGQRYMQKRLQGGADHGAGRYPHNIRTWMNLSAVGDLTAVDPTLADDFAPMCKLGLVESIDDFRLHNYFRLNGELNTHAEYGYLVNTKTARLVGDWWRSHRPGL